MSTSIQYSVLSTTIEHLEDSHIVYALLHTHSYKFCHHLVFFTTVFVDALAVPACGGDGRRVGAPTVAVAVPEVEGPPIPDEPLDDAELCLLNDDSAAAAFA